MSLYPMSIRRCQHIKVNGTQCASPALRNEKHCYFHMQWRLKSMEVNLNVALEERATMTLPTLEDANSIQAGLAEILRLLATNQIDCRRAALMLYALQTASINLNRTSFEPVPTRVVIDRECVEQRPIGATAWSKVAGREYDELSADGLTSAADENGDEGNDYWRTMPEVPENERLLPGESQRDRYIRVQKQKGLEPDPALIAEPFWKRAPKG
jgi:hypothetical protein